MMRYVIVLALLCSACGSDSAGADGYRFEREEWNRTEYVTRNVLYPNLTELRRAAPAETRKAGHELAAWSRIKFDSTVPGGMICEKHIVDPAVVHAPEFIGHEDIHCIKGRWHE